MAVETRVRFPVTAFPDVALLRRGKISPSWVRTSDLQVNSLTRYRLRHGGPADLLPGSSNLDQTVTSDGIEPPLSDLESEVLPLHHEAVLMQRQLSVVGIMQYSAMRALRLSAVIHRVA